MPGGRGGGGGPGSPGYRPWTFKFAGIAADPGNPGGGPAFMNPGGGYIPGGRVGILGTPVGLVGSGLRSPVYLR